MHVGAQPRKRSKSLGISIPNPQRSTFNEQLAF
jgi:hypothetical protein